MDQVRMGMVLVGFGLLVTVGCASAPLPESTTSGKLFEVQIDDFVTPRLITVKGQDEVRWVNMRSSAVHISLVNRQGPTISCLNGFELEGFEFGGSQTPDSVFGATVNSNEFASLCFSETGIYEYTVRTEKVGSGEGEPKLAGTVMVK